MNIKIYNKLIQDFSNELNLKFYTASEKRLIAFTIRNYLTAQEYDEENFFNDCINYVQSIDRRYVSFLSHIQKKYENNPKELVLLTIEDNNIKGLIKLNLDRNIDLSKIVNIPKRKEGFVKTAFSNWQKQFPWIEEQKVFDIQTQRYNNEKIKLRALTSKNMSMKEYAERGQLNNFIEGQKEGVNIHADNDYYLKIAIENNKLNLIKYLLEQGCICEDSNHSGNLLLKSLKEDPNLCKELIISGMLSQQSEEFQNAFKDKVVKQIEAEKLIIEEKNKLIETNNWIYTLQKKYLSVHKNQANIKVNSEIKKTKSPFEVFVELAPTVKNTKKYQRKKAVEVIQEITTNKVSTSPFTHNYFANSVKEKIEPLPIIKEVSIENREIKSKQPIKKIINLNGVEISQKQLQYEWDKALILGFANQEKYNMRVLIAKFTKENYITLDLLNENNINFKRFPIQKAFHHFDVTPYVFICKYLPNVREELFQATFTEINNNIDTYTKKIGRLKNEVLEYAINKTLTKEDKKELQETAKIYKRAKEIREIHRYNKEETNKHNWRKVK